MELIPLHILRHIIHDGDNAQIEGFRKLFDYLNVVPAASDLRQLVVDYFNDHAHLREYLLEALSRSSLSSLSTMTLYLGDTRTYNPAGHPGATAPPFKSSPSGGGYFGEILEMA